MNSNEDAKKFSASLSCLNLSELVESKFSKVYLFRRELCIGSAFSVLVYVFIIVIVI